MSVKLKTYQGIEIRVFESGEFEATIEGHEIEKSSLREIEKEIDTALRNQKAVKKKAFAIKVVSDELKTSVVTGLHSRLGTLLMKPKLEDERFGATKDVFFDCPRIRELFKEKMDIKKRIDAIGESAKKFEIKVKKNRYGEITAAQYDLLIVQLENCVKEAEKASCEK